MRSIAVFLMLLLALPAQAQDWATRAVCDVNEAKIHPQVFAPATLDELELDALEIPNATGKYWRITSVEGAVSHLWGTFHSNNRLILALTDQIKTDIDAARLVALEADYVVQSRPEFKAISGSDRRWNVDGRDGYEALDIPEEIDGWIRERFVGLGWGPEGPDLLKLPAVAEILLYDPCSDFGTGVYPIQDNRIQMLGYLAGAEVLGLEEPLAFYDKFIAGQNLKLSEALIATFGAYLDPAQGAEHIATGITLYLQGKVGVSMAWEKSHFANRFGAEQGLEWLRLTDEYLLDERNHSFLGKVQPELEEGGVFMAIGNFHLPGETGMVALLRNAGFTVERVALPGEVPE